MNVIVMVAGGRVEVLQASPLLRTLCEGLPEAHVTFACAPEAVALARGLDGAGEVIGLRTLEPRARLGAWLHDWGRLRRRRYDAALLCTTRARHRLLAYLAGFPRRLGPSGGLTGFLLSDHVREPAGENRAATWLRLAQLLGLRIERHRPLFRPGPEAVRVAEGRLHSTGIADGRLLVALAPGSALCEVPGVDPVDTEWASERWAHLANALWTRHGAGIVFLGGPGDEERVAEAMADVTAEAADLCDDDLDLPTAAALLRECDLLVAGDTPLLHLAAAVGTPAVGLFGPTDGHRRGPYGDEHRVLQAIPAPPPADRRRRLLAPPESVMERIRVEDVLASIESEL